MKRGRNGPRFIMLDHYMCDSDAFESLSHSALRVLLSIYRQRKSTEHGTTNDNPLICPYADMKGISSTASKNKGIQELVEKGFIEFEGGGLYKQANRFILSGDWINWKEEKQNKPKKRTRPNFKKTTK